MSGDYARPGGAQLDGIASAQNPIVRRYRDAYVVANTVVGVGSAIKIAGALLGLLIGLAALSTEGVLRIAGIAYATVLAAAFIVAGILVVAIGQMNQATLDVAVHGSPFMTELEKARAMNVNIVLPQRGHSLSNAAEPHL